jgi:hypothetical protein
MSEFWTPEMRLAVVRLLKDSLPDENWLRSQADAFGAFPVGWDLCSYWFLRPEGEVVIADQEFEPGKVMTSRERGTVLSAYVRLAQRYSWLLAASPTR